MIQIWKSCYRGWTYKRHGDFAKSEASRVRIALRIEAGSIGVTTEV